ncbi:MAG: hypothetical protein ACR2M0_16290 [Chloroflexia bacterium]
MTIGKQRGLGLLVLLLLALAASGCLEQITTTRIPAGAARNFFYFVAHDEQADANTYWAPGLAPADAAAQISRAATALAGYDTEVTAADAVRQDDGSMLATVSGHFERKGEAPTGTEQPLMRARLIEKGPGWRLTEFTLLCCGVSK